MPLPEKSTTAVLDRQTERVDDDGLMHVCGTYLTDRAHRCYRGNPECVALCGRDISFHEYRPTGALAPAEADCIVCDELERAI